METTEEDEYRKIGRRIRILRARKEMTQHELAGRIGIAPGYLSDIEHGKIQPTLKNLFKIHKILECPMMNLLEDRDDEEGIGVQDIVRAMHVMRENRQKKQKEMKT